MEEQIKQKYSTIHKHLFFPNRYIKYFAMFLFIILPFVGFYLGMKYQEIVTINIPVVQVSKTAISKSLTPSIPKSISFASKKLGITFFHTPFIGYGSENENFTKNPHVKTLEEGNRVYVYIDGDNPRDGPFVEVLIKSPTDTIVQAVKKITFNYPDSCEVKINQTNRYPTSYEEAYINCNVPGPGGDNAFYLIDSDYPTKILYIRLGGYPIESSLGNYNSDWADTLKITN
jgi:hypothetical protein